MFRLEWSVRRPGWLTFSWHPEGECVYSAFVSATLMFDVEWMLYKLTEHGEADPAARLLALAPDPPTRQALEQTLNEIAARNLLDGIP